MKDRKDELINTLTRLDTACYRCTPSGTYKREPPLFRFDLYKIYDKLSEEDLKTLINLKSK